MRDFWKANPKFEAVQIDDVATDDFTNALEGMNSLRSLILYSHIQTDTLPNGPIGVDAVLHVASPLPGKEDADGLIKARVAIYSRLFKSLTSGFRVPWTERLMSSVKPTKRG